MRLAPPAMAFITPPVNPAQRSKSAVANDKFAVTFFTSLGFI
jgi:hypothetical protein